MTDDLRVLVETAMAEQIEAVEGIIPENDAWYLNLAKAALDAALSVRGPSGTPALVEMLMEQVGDEVETLGASGAHYKEMVRVGYPSTLGHEYEIGRRPVFGLRTEETP